MMREVTFSRRPTLSQTQAHKCIYHMISFKSDTHSIQPTLSISHV